MTSVRMSVRPLRFAIALARTTTLLIAALSLLGIMARYDEVQGSFQTVLGEHGVDATDLPDVEDPSAIDIVYRLIGIIDLIYFPD